MGRSIKRRWGRWLIGGVLTLVLLWLAFFDSHALIKRVRFSQEHAHLVEENRQLRQKIEALQETLKTAPSDEMIERIAREQYGMRQPGETVYRIEARRTEEK